MDVVAGIEVGGVEVQRRLLVSSLPLSQRSEPVSGIVGADLLSDFDVEISVPEQRLRLYRANGCQDSYVPWQGTWFAIPVHSTWGRRLLGPVEVQGHPISAVLDTGADFPVLEADAARRIGVTG